jgi:hypothetical protein
MRLTKPNEQEVALVLISSRRIAGFSKENEQLRIEKETLKRFLHRLGKEDPQMS